MDEDFCFCGRRIPAERRRFCSAFCCELASRVGRYGLDGAGYLRMLAAQGGACALCDADLSRLETRVVVIDHDHVSGVARGIVCQSCNIKLRWLESTGGYSSQAWAERAGIYLANARATPSTARLRFPRGY